MPGLARWLRSAVKGASYRVLGSALTQAAYARWSCLLAVLRRQVAGRRKGRIVLYDGVDEAIILGGHGQHCFFGYYDLCPFDETETRVLGHRVAARLSDGRSKVAEVGYFELDSRRFIRLGETVAWCWQQGARLQWLPGARHLALYNDVLSDQYGCRIVDVEREQRIGFLAGAPVYAVSPDGNKGISLNFSRLQRLRPGYGYDRLPDDTEGVAAPDDDGVFLVDLASGRTSLILSVAQAVLLDYRSEMDGVPHYFNHLSWSPDGSRILLFHIWGRASTRRTRMLTCDADGSGVRVIADEGMVSHFAWTLEGNLVAFAFHSSHGAAYYRYDLETNERVCLSADTPLPDGHPTVIGSRGELLTDTYPDRVRDQTLYFLSGSGKEIVNVAKFYAPCSYRGEVRCDLHPRLSRSGRRICVDSAHLGYRSIVALTLRQPCLP